MIANAHLALCFPADDLQRKRRHGYGAARERSAIGRSTASATIAKPADR